MADIVELPSPCLVVLVGPGASGKSTWAAAHFPPGAVVASDALRALVGTGPDDIVASADAFALLDETVRRRLARHLTTVIDTLGLDPIRRKAWRESARAADVPAVAVTFDTPAAECRARNRARHSPIPADALTTQLRERVAAKDQLANEGWDLVLSEAPVRSTGRSFATASGAARRQAERPIGLRFGLHLGSYTFAGGRAATADAIKDVAAGAEASGFDGIYVMDHHRQIPQLGRPWDDFLESYTTLAYLAAATERVTLGTLVTGVTFRNPAHLAKIVATLDVLSGGRAVCGLGLAWFGDEHEAYGWAFPPARDRYALLEDVLELLPLVWGPGSPSFEGRVISVPETLCYPRPLQEHVPVIVGGGGERRTLRLAARYADAANVLGDPATVARKAAALRAHCLDVGRDPDAVAITQLTTALVGHDDRHVGELVERLRRPRQDRVRYATSVNAGTVADHIGRFREVAEAGAQEVMVRLPDPRDPGSLDAMALVIAAFR